MGAAVARRLAGKGGRVVINYTRSVAEAEETAAACNALGGEAILCQADVSVDEGLAGGWRGKPWTSGGRIDGLVNNAARFKIVPHADLEGLTSEDFSRIFAVNGHRGVPDWRGR